MFNAEDLKCFDTKYFSIIAFDDHDVIIMYKNTGHYCYFHNPEYPRKGTVIIFHKHKASHTYHQHGRVNTLKQAVKRIKSHDKWQKIMEVNNKGRTFGTMFGVMSPFFLYGVKVEEAGHDRVPLVHEKYVTWLKQNGGENIKILIHRRFER